MDVGDRHNVKKPKNAEDATTKGGGRRETNILS